MNGKKQSRAFRADLMGRERIYHKIIRRMKGLFNTIADNKSAAFKEKIKLKIAVDMRRAIGKAYQKHFEIFNDLVFYDFVFIVVLL